MSGEYWWVICTHQYSPLITHGKLKADHSPIFTTHHTWKTHDRSPTNIHYSSHMVNSRQITHQYSPLITRGKLMTDHPPIFITRGKLTADRPQYSALITRGKLMTDHSPMFTEYWWVICYELTMCDEW
jgi:hypothetical protein